MKIFFPKRKTRANAVYRPIQFCAHARVRVYIYTYTYACIYIKKKKRKKEPQFSISQNCNGCSKRLRSRRFFSSYRWNETSLDPINDKQAVDEDRSDMSYLAKSLILRQNF